MRAGGGDLQTEEEAAAAARQIETLKKELDVIDSFDKADYDGLERLGFRADRPAAAPEPVETATLPTDGDPSTNGSG